MVARTDYREHLQHQAVPKGNCWCPHSLSEAGRSPATANSACPWMNTLQENELLVHPPFPAPIPQPLTPAVRSPQWELVSLSETFICGQCQGRPALGNPLLNARRSCHTGPGSALASQHQQLRPALLGEDRAPQGVGRMMAPAQTRDTK